MKVVKKLTLFELRSYRSLKLAKELKDKCFDYHIVLVLSKWLQATITSLTSLTPLTPENLIKTKYLTNLKTKAL